MTGKDKQKKATDRGERAVREQTKGIQRKEVKPDDHSAKRRNGGDTSTGEQLKSCSQGGVSRYTSDTVGMERNFQDRGSPIPPADHNQTTQEVRRDTVDIISLLSNTTIIEELVDRVANRVIDKLKESIDFNTQVISELRQELARRDDTISQLQLQLNDRTDDLEQYQRRNNLRIFGIPETPGEDTNRCVMDVAAKLNVAIDPLRIDRSHRVGSREAGKKRPIIVRFVSYADRAALFRSKKFLRNTGITVREDLTKTRTDIVKQAVSHFGLHGVWTADGVILIRIGDTRHRVKTLRDLDTLKKRFPASRT